MNDTYLPDKTPSKEAVKEVTDWLIDVTRNRDCGDSWWKTYDGIIHPVVTGYGVAFVKILVDELRNLTEGGNDTNG